MWRCRVPKENTSSSISSSVRWARSRASTRRVLKVNGFKGQIRPILSDERSPFCTHFSAFHKIPRVSQFLFEENDFTSLSHPSSSCVDKGETGPNLHTVYVNDRRLKFPSATLQSPIDIDYVPGRHFRILHATKETTSITSDMGIFVATHLAGTCPRS